MGEMCVRVKINRSGLTGFLSKKVKLGTAAVNSTAEFCETVQIKDSTQWHLYVFLMHFFCFLVAILLPQNPPQRWQETTRYGFYFMPGVRPSASRIFNALYVGK
jgi:hypothetical protein